MRDSLILEGLLSMVTELKEKQEAQVTLANWEETLERLGQLNRHCRNCTVTWLFL
jgi:hypothetical protein